MNDLLQAYGDPRFRAVLGVIRDAEGTSNYSDPYRVAGGGSVTLSQFDTPDFSIWGFKDKSGKKNKSSATGAYQFLGKTWNGLQAKYGFSDFSPQTQDLAALALLKESGAFPYIQRGDYLGALHKARRIWASLPGAGYNQQERDKGFLQRSLQKHLSNSPNQYPSHMSEPAQVDNPGQPTNEQIIPDATEPVKTADPYATLFNIPEPIPTDLAYTQHEQQPVVVNGIGFTPMIKAFDI